MKSHRAIAATVVTMGTLVLATPVPGEEGAGPGGRSTPGAGLPRPVEIVVRDADFEWVDAAIGAAAALGFVSLVTGAIRLKHATRPTQAPWGVQTKRKETRR